MLEELHCAGSAHQSSAMAISQLTDIKVQALLEEVRVDYTRSRIVESAAASLKESLLSLPDKLVSSSLVSTFAKDLGVPDGKAQLKFQKPEAVEIVGSYASHTAAKPFQFVDLAVRLPKSCFHEKDYLNHRYHVKRALYLAVLKKVLAKCACVGNIKWSSFCEDARKPVLLLFPAPDEKGATTESVIRIVPTLGSDTFNVTKLAPSKNNVRNCFKDGMAQPTPHYNSSILEDMTIESSSAMLKEALLGNEAMRDAVLLLKVWSRQRGIYDAPDSLNGFLSTILIAYLASPAGGKRINQHMTALQVFRLTMESLASGNVLEKGIFMQAAGVESVGFEMKKALQQAFKVVISGSQVWVNFASRMSKTAAAELRGEAFRTLAAMKDTKDEGFMALFMTKIDFAAKFDYHVRVRLSESEHSSSPRFSDEDSYRLYEQQLESLLIRGLGDRAHLVRVIRRSCSSGWLPKRGLLKLGHGDLWAGISLVNLDTALRMADVGPSADNKEEARKFRAFWGSRAELRRFKDGNISETAVWECQGWQRHLIIQQIVEHVLHRHLFLAPESLHIVSGQLDYALLENGTDPTSTASKLMEVFGKLSKRLRDIVDLPLKVVAVQPISPAFSQTDVFPPQPHPLAEDAASQKIPTGAVPVHVDPLEIVLQLEGSGNWPEAAVAIQKTKTAFCLQIARSLQKKWGVGCIAAEDAVDITMEGFVFRLVLMYDKDHTRAMVSKDDEQLGTVSPIHDLLLRSSHASLIQGLYSKYPAFGPSVRLAKRWIWSHLFSSFLAEEAVELLVAYVFVHHSPHRPPSSRVTGFLRFLHLLTTHEWALEPLVIDVNGDFTSNYYTKIMAKFAAARHGPQVVGTGPEDIRGPSMYIATSYDFGCKTWTHETPSQQVLKRLIAYAKSSVNLLTELVKGNAEDRKWLSIFRTPLSSYDILVELHLECLSRPNRVLFPPEGLRKSVLSTAAPKFSPRLVPAILKMGIRAAREHLIIGLNPVEEFVEDLKTKYGDHCKIWYDPVGSNLLGLTLSDEAFSAKVKSAKRKRVENEQVVLNLDTFLKDVAAIGEGLVKSIHLSSARRKDLGPAKFQCRVF